MGPKVQVVPDAGNIALLNVIVAEFVVPGLVVDQLVVEVRLIYSVLTVPPIPTWAVADDVPTQLKVP